MGTWFKDYVVPIFAIAGIIQPWGIALYKKFFRQPKIDLFPSGMARIDFDNIGPSVSLNGTLRAVNKDIFVEKMEVVIVRRKDSLTHRFPWFALQPDGGIGDIKDVKIEVPFSFSIPSGQAHRFNIIFFDADTFNEIHRYSTELNQLWFESLKDINTNQLSYEEIASTIATLDHRDDGKELKEKLLENYRAKQKHVDAFSAISRLNYWQPGEYDLKVNIHTRDPDKVIAKEYMFGLCSDECQKLNFNIVNIIDAPAYAYLNLQFIPNYCTYINVEPCRAVV